MTKIEMSISKKAYENAKDRGFLRVGFLLPTAIEWCEEYQTDDDLKIVTDKNNLKSNEDRTFEIINWNLVEI